MEKKFKKNIFKIFLVIFFVVLFAVTNPLIVYAGTWIERAPMPTARYGHSCILGPDDLIYCIGGLTEEGDYTDVNEVYNPENDTWDLRVSMLAPRSPVLVVSDNLIYAIGNSIGENPATMIINEAFNTITNEWEEKTSLPMTDEFFYSFGGTNYNNKIYIVGLGVIKSSIPDEFSIKVYEYDLTEDSWTEKYSEEISEEEVFFYPTSSSLDSKIYLFGGIFRTAMVLSDDVWSYDIETNSFEKKADMPSVRALASVITGPDGKIYIFGGTEEVGSGGPPPATSRTDIYNSETDTWQEGDPIPTARLLPSAVYNGKESIYVIGGLINPPTDINEEYNLFSPQSSEDEKQPADKEKQEDKKPEDKKKLTELPETGENNQTLFTLLISLSTITPCLLEKIKLIRKKKD